MYRIIAVSAAGCFWIALGGCALLPVATTGAAKSGLAVAAWPTRAWGTATPESQGFDSAKLAEAIDHAREHKLAIHSLVIVRNGFVVLDANFFPYQAGQLHDLASVTKSVTATLVGVAIQQKRIDSVEKPLLDFFPQQIQNATDARKSRITLSSLMTMRSGLDCRFDDGEVTLREMRASADWVGSMLRRAMVAEPDTKWEYCSSGLHVLSGVIAKATGQSTLEYARAGLFGPLGISEAIWPADSQGVNFGWGDLRLRPLGMAKIGLLYLHDGAWDGQQLVDAGFMAEATRAQSKTTFGGDEYGYGWWIKSGQDPLEYEAVGRGAQRISVIPGKSTVVVFTGGEFEPGEIGAFIGDALKSDEPLPENPIAQRTLRAAQARAEQPAPSHRKQPLPATARAISGKRFEFDVNPLGLDSLALEFGSSTQAQLAIRYYTDTVKGGVHVARHRIGLRGVPLRSLGGRFGFPVALDGTWQDAQTFLLHYDEVANNSRVTLRLRFHSDQVEVEAKDAGSDKVLHLVGTSSLAL